MWSLESVFHFHCIIVRGLIWVIPECSSGSPCVLCLVAQSCPTLQPHGLYSPPGFSVHGDSPGQNTGVGCHALLQSIFWTCVLNLGLPHCREILYHLSHQGSLLFFFFFLSGFPYFLQFKSEFYNKEGVHDLATVRSWSFCFVLFCFFWWLYRASPFLAAKNIINLIFILTIWWCLCVESSLVLLDEGVWYDQCSTFFFFRFFSHLGC